MRPASSNHTKVVAREIPVRFWEDGVFPRCRSKVETPSDTDAGRNEFRSLREKRDKTAFLHSVFSSRGIESNNQGALPSVRSWIRPSRTVSMLDIIPAASPFALRLPPWY